MSKWAEPTESINQGKQHAMRKSGHILWCGICGSFAETRASGLVGTCEGTPSQQHGVGRSRLNRLNNLRAGLHPVTFARLPEATKVNGEPLQGDGVYARLKQTSSEVTPEGFVKYIPEVFAPPPRLSHRTADEKMRQRLGRVKLKEAIEARRVRKSRKAEAKREARILYENFVGCGDEAIEEVVNPKSPEQAGGCSDEEFWNELTEIEPPVLRAHRLVEEPWQHTQRIAKPSRMQRLVACLSSKNEVTQS